MGETLIISGLNQRQLATALRAGTAIKVCQGLYLKREPTPDELAEIVHERWERVCLTGYTSLLAFYGQRLEFPLELVSTSSLPASRYWNSHRLRQPVVYRNRKLRILHPLMAAAHEPDDERARHIIETRYEGFDGNTLFNQDKSFIRRLSPRVKRLLESAAISADSWAERQVVNRLRQRGAQVVSNFVIGEYRWDMALLRQKIAVEIDGFEFHGDRATFIKDHWKRNDATLRGWLVLSYTGSCVKYNLDDIVEQILEARHPDLTSHRHTAVMKWHRFYDGAWEDVEVLY